MHVTIREAQAADYEPLCDLLRELNPDDPAPDAHTLDAFERITGHTDLTLLVVEAGGQLLATCYLNVISNLTRGGRPYALIENVVTRASHRNQGIGKRLLNHALEHAWSRGCYKVMLLTGSEEATTHAFYRACGFSGDAKQGYVIRSTARQNHFPREV
ncbi:GNAT family N-acetyltransferase [Billgrantia endophytica]|uniref:GNAT family N-acetyltransferase n=1 Tax=Billgrantia endophytica TaxID=2033802 RepID=A0A2N7U1L6_9GAMM|nr:GNAT family N-acetyltransferase [Halomonas endophytica]PMR74332.1 GNAT family N-acetyltransferase [Halomonas endophytica]